MLKRSWLSIKRKLGRTVILTLIFFMMANLVLAAFIIKSAVSAQMDYAKSTLGGTISIQADMGAIRENQEEEMKNGSDPSKMFKSMSRPSVNVNTANEIVTTYTDYIKDYSYEISVSANSYNLETVETKSFGGRGGSMMGGMPNMGNFFGGANADDDSSEATLDSDITIYGINAYAYIDGVDDETITIKDGTYFDEDSTDSVMVSYEFAELNSLKVGDTFKIKNIYTEKSISLTVIGIYDTSSERANANTMYMNTETAAKFFDTDEYNNGNYAVGDVKFYMINSDKADEFVEKVNAEFVELSENNLKFAVDTSEYDSLSSSIESVGGFADTILIIVIIAAIIIITLIVTINVKDRRYEIGVLMSLGASKKNVIGQIATELLIIGTLGFALASVTGTVFATSLGNDILESQATASSKQSERNFGRPGAMMGGMPGGFNGGSRNSSSKSDIPDMPDGTAPNMKDIIGGRDSKKKELDINAELLDYLLLFVTGYLVIVVALILPSVSIMRYQPKEILAGKE
ncbi:ABC transporter permease [Candidatus Saccharibacteria bacterium]|nr:ABC transporter permease [Candidatus Saccharibacteria bacterium]